MPNLEYPIIVIAYNDEVRSSLEKSLSTLGLSYCSAATFLQAEDIALSGLFSGILLDLPSIVKAKDEEKIVACSLTGFYPTLRVRTMAGMLIPMTMPGEARQESSLNDFIQKRCQNFVPRRLRASRRKDVVVSTVSRLASPDEYRGFTLNISWGGAFIVDVLPEKYVVGQQFQLYFHEIETEVPVRVSWIQPWGLQRRPGIGVQFLESNPMLDTALLTLLQHDRTACKDRMVAR